MVIHLLSLTICRSGRRPAITDLKVKAEHALRGRLKIVLQMWVLFCEIWGRIKTSIKQANQYKVRVLPLIYLHHSAERQDTEEWLNKTVRHNTVIISDWYTCLFLIIT